MSRPPRPDRMPVSRRLLAGGLLAAASIAAVGAAPAPAGAQEDQAARATAFVRAAGDELLGIINGSGDAESRRAALLAFVDRAIDVSAVARFCLGRYLHAATPAQANEYVDLFRRVLANNVSAKLGEYKGVAFRLTRTVAGDGGEAVGTVITRPNNAPTNVQWVVGFAGGGPRIVDVIAEGTSLRLTQRSDYASFLGRNDGDIEALLRGMRRQAGG